MTVRLPRGHVPRRPRGRNRDQLLCVAVSAVALVFGLRLIMAAFGIKTWTLGWRVVDLATGPVVAAFLRVPALRHTPVGRLTLADLVVALLAALAAMLVLASLANRRPS